MSIPGAKIKSAFIPAPTGGMNLVSPPNELAENEARLLHNYFVYEWGIRERGALTLVAMPVGGDYPRCMFSFSSTTFVDGAWLIAGAADVYKYDGTTFTAITTVDAVNTVSSMFAFNKVIFMPDSFTSEIHSYNTATDTYADTSFTGPTGVPISGFAYKNRAYILCQRLSSFQYGGVTSVSGALSAAYDVGQFFQKGTALVWGSSWNFNQGVTNDELFVVGNDAGEVFVFAGDYPAAANWQLVARAQIPAPIIRATQAAGLFVPHVSLGQDVLIATTRGVVSLQQVFAGRKNEAVTDYYSISRKLGYVIGNVSAGKSATYPFAYFGNQTGDLYVLNYELGAWSKFPAIGAMSCVCVQAAPLDGSSASQGASVVLIGQTGGGFFKLDEGATAADASVQYDWITPYFNFGSGLQKHSKYMRVLSRDMASTSVKNGAGISVDFDDTAYGQTDTKTTTVTNTDHKIQELAPAATGKWFTYRLSKNPVASTLNEISGFEAVYEEGGAY